MKENALCEIHDAVVEIKSLIDDLGRGDGEKNFLDAIFTEYGMTDRSASRLAIVTLLDSSIINEDVITNVISNAFNVQSNFAIYTYEIEVLKKLRLIQHKTQKIKMDWMLSEPNFSNHIKAILKRGYV